MFFSLFHLQQKIAEASNDIARKYYEETPESKRTGSRVIAMMRAAGWKYTTSTQKVRHRPPKQKLFNFDALERPL
jgi:hypothetical protein